MGIFSKNEPIILKESDSARKHLAALESFRGSLPAAVEKQLEADIRAMKAGIAGEERILYELRNSHIDMYVLQDLFLEHEGLSAQIDFLVLTKQRFFVLECKNLYGNIEVNAHGDFIRTFGGRKREGIYSPLTQNQRHIELIRAMKRADRNMMINMLLDKDFDDLYRSFIVLANPKTVLDDRSAPDEVRSKIIRVDQLVATINAVNAERGAYHDKSPMSAIRKAAEWFLERDTGARTVDYAAKYREMAAERVGGTENPDGGSTSAGVLENSSMHSLFSETDALMDKSALQPTSTSRIEPVSASVVIEDGQAPSCPRCGAPMILRTAKRGAHAGNKFYGCSNYPHCRGIVNIEQ